MVRWLGLGLLGLCLVACQAGESALDGGILELPLDERLSPGQVRAGVITSQSELLEGPEAQGWLGDYKLYNDRVAFVVQNIDSPRGWGPYGGSLLDADRIRPEGQAGGELFQEMFPVINLLGVRPTFAEVVNDGSDGNAAVVRILGEHQGIPLVDAATDGSIEPLDLEISHEYLLAADADHLLIRTSLRLRGMTGRNASVGDLVINGNTTLDFAPGTGLLPAEYLPTGEYPYYTGFTGDLCYLYAGMQDDIRAPISIETITPFVVADGVAPPVRSDEPSFEVERVLIVGGGDQDACLRILTELRGETGTGLLSGTVTDTRGDPQAGALVQAKHADELWVVQSATLTGEDGTFEMQLPRREYVLEIQAAGGEALTSDPIDLASGQAGWNPELPAAARLSYLCQGQDLDGHDTGPLPCKISLQSGPEAPMTAAVDMRFTTFGITGEGEFPIGPGDWTVTLSRGPEYSIHRQDIAVAAGETAEVSGILQRQVDTRGFIAADLHSHTYRSIDNAYNITDKLGSNLCEGVELLVITDHDCHTDATPFLQAMSQAASSDLGAWMRLVVGNEVSPLYGHLTAFPLPTHAAGWSYQQIPWTLYQDNLYQRMLEFPEIYQRIRELGGEIINIAHPLSGYFESLGFDPPEVMPRLDSLPADVYSDGYDTIEMLNSKGTASLLNQNRLLWSAMNNQGVFKTAVGVSDSHSRYSEAGFGRTMIASGSDAPADINLNEIWSHLRAGRAMVSGGIFLRLSIGEAGPGDLLAVGTPLEARLQVQAADWVEVDQVELVANGETIETLLLGPPGEVDPDNPAVRFDQVIALTPTVDTWYAALAYGPDNATLNPVCRGCRPVGMTNAIRVDVDGNGQFDPPEP